MWSCLTVSVAPTSDAEVAPYKKIGWCIRYLRQTPWYIETVNEGLHGVRVAAHVLISDYFGDDAHNRHVAEYQLDCMAKYYSVADTLIPILSRYKELEPFSEEREEKRGFFRRRVIMSPYDYTDQRRDIETYHTQILRSALLGLAALSLSKKGARSLCRPRHRTLRLTLHTLQRAFALDEPIMKYINMVVQGMNRGNYPVERIEAFQEAEEEMEKILKDCVDLVNVQIAGMKKLLALIEKDPEDTLSRIKHQNFLPTLVAGAERHPTEPKVYLLFAEIITAFARDIPSAKYCGDQVIPTLIRILRDGRLVMLEDEERRALGRKRRGKEKEEFLYVDYEDAGQAALWALGALALAESNLFPMKAHGLPFLLKEIATDYQKRERRMMGREKKEDLEERDKRPKKSDKMESGKIRAAENTDEDIEGSSRAVAREEKKELKTQETAGEERFLVVPLVLQTAKWETLPNHRQTEAADEGNGREEPQEEEGQDEGEASVMAEE